MTNHLWKVPLLGAYHLATSPYRHWKMRSLMASGCAPIFVLFYHRVAERNHVPWSIDNRRFACQMKWLQARYDMISMDEVRSRMASGNTRPAVHITFDDGYAENCDFAIPFLLERKIPVTYFVTLDNVLHQMPFPHDAKLGKRFPVNTVSQLRQMSDAGIVIGAHTRSHPDLGSLHDEQSLFDEIATAGAELQQALGCPVRYFAFPFGLKHNIPRAGYRIAREWGYEAVMSAYGGYNFPGDDNFHIQRVHGDPEMTRFKNAVTLDPRKLRLRRLDVEWQLEGGEPPVTGQTRQAHIGPECDEAPAGLAAADGVLPVATSQES